MSSGQTIDMSSEAVTARIKRACELGNLYRALIFTRAAAARARLDQPSPKEEPKPQDENFKRE
jgi:hypothetical protein